MAKGLGNPVAIDMTGNESAEYRTHAIKAGANPRTFNNRLGYLRSVFNVLHQPEEIDHPNPLARVRPPSPPAGEGVDVPGR